MKRHLLVFAALAVITASCGNVARVAQPAAVYNEITADDYAAAEAHFSGSEGIAPPPPPPVDLYWNDERCQELLDKRDAMAAVTAGICGLTGASGLGTVIPEDASKEMRLGFGLTTIALGTVCTSMTLATKSLSNKFEMYCSVERPVPAEHPASDEVELAPEPDEFKDADGGVVD